MFFNGQHRQAPVVSLGGSRRLENREVLIERAKEERRKRNEQKRKTDAAAKLQRSWKSYHRRRDMAKQFHQEFDETLSDLITPTSKRQATAALLGKLIVQIGIFYQDTSDISQQMIQLCTLLCKHHGLLRQDIQLNPAQWRLRLQLMLSLTLRFLAKHAETTDVSVSMPLRLLEVLLQPSLYCPEHQKGILEPLALQLCQRNGYFATLLRVLLKRIPAPVDLSPKAPSPFADGLLQVLCLPLNAITVQRDAAVTQLCRDLLPLSCFATIRLFVLPALTCHIPMNTLLSCSRDLAAASTRQPASAGQSTPPVKISHSVFPSRQPLCFPLPDNSAGWTLYSLLVATEYSYLSHDSNTQSVDALSPLLSSVADLLQHIAPAGPIHILDGEQVVDLQVTHQNDDEDDGTWSSSDAMMASRIPQYLVPRFLRGQCQRLLTGDTKLVRCILSVVGKDKSQSVQMSYFRGLAAICSHFLLYRSTSFRKSVLFNQLCFQPCAVQHLWRRICSMSITAPSGHRKPLLELIMHSIFHPPASVAQPFLEHMSTFCALLTSHLASVDANDFKSGRMAFSTEELLAISTTLLDVSLALLRSDTLGVTKIVAESMTLNLDVMNRFGPVHAAASTAGSAVVSPHGWGLLFKLISTFLRSLHARDAKTPILPTGHWLVKASQFDVMSLEMLDPSKVFTEGSSSEGPCPSTISLAQTIIVMRTLPFITPFLERAKLFLRLVDQERQTWGRGPAFWNENAHNMTVRRSHVYEDAYAELCALPVSELKRELTVSLINFHGLGEAGIDGGGVLREFLVVFVKTAFDSSLGFFKYTDDQRIYPNPEVKAIHRDFLIHYKFLGKMLGKVIYENMLVDLPFASFFMQKVIDGPKSQLSFDHLESLDPEVYKNLLFLRAYSGDVSSLGLNFTIVNNDIGQKEVVELKPGGANIAITNENCAEYIAAVADYKLNKQIESQCAAFREGLASMINISWLRLFTASEAQVLIAGAQVPVDLDDLRQHTVYSGSFNQDHMSVKLFWDVVYTFDADQRQLLLKFVTSCSRPPLLGFQDLLPKFAIHNALDVERLPSASTCMNLLKLPPYKDLETMRRRLIYAISSDAGFELS